MSRKKSIDKESFFWDTFNFGNVHVSITDSVPKMFFLQILNSEFLSTAPILSQHMETITHMRTIFISDYKGFHRLSPCYSLVIAPQSFYVNLFLASKYKMNFDSFSHGQIQSKVWLCKELERFVHANLKVAVLGSWYNLVAFMLLTRNPDRYQHILGVDIDPETKPIADKITDAWRIGSDYKVENIIADANLVNLAGYDLVINCSPEHMEFNDWFENLEYGTMVCIQSSDVQTKDDDVWKCVNANESLEDLVLKYPLSKYLYSGEKEIRYSEDNGYKRFMLIGIK